VPWPWNAAALPEIMAGAVQESKRGAQGDGGQTGEQQDSNQTPPPEREGSGAAEARARPNVEVNRRAEGASELNRRLGAVEKGSGALERSALPEIMAGAVEERKRCGIAGRWADRGAAGQQPGSVAGARGSGAAEARARPNVEVNRRAEGTSELNRRLGDVEKGAAALERCGVAGDYGRAVEESKCGVQGGG